MSRSSYLLLPAPFPLLSLLLLFLLFPASSLSSQLLWLLFLFVFLFPLEQVSQRKGQTHLWELVETLFGDPSPGR